MQQSNMNRFSQNSCSRFHHRFTHSGVSVNGVMDVFRSRSQAAKLIHIRQSSRWHQRQRYGRLRFRQTARLTSNFTKPSEVLDATALPDAWNGNLPTLYAMPSSLSAFSVLPDTRQLVEGSRCNPGK